MCSGCSAENRERVDGGNGPLPNFPSTAVSAAIYSSFPEVRHRCPRQSAAIFEPPAASAAATSAGPGHAPALALTSTSVLLQIGAIIHAHPASIMAVSAADAEAGTILPISEPSFMFYER